MKEVIAYFSAEFGISEALPIYSGGLGILAGDFVKAAGDENLPLVGVGIFYRKGYFEQRIGQNGTQEALYPVLNPANLPICPVVDQSGKPLEIEVPINGDKVCLRVWKAQVKSTVVYLMDADVEKNESKHRGLTDSLYGGSQETRLSQEIILGVGGVRVLRALGIKPKVWHMNEGHAALLIMERLREYTAIGAPFNTALEIVRSNTLFTTHTPVPAGHDLFSLGLVQKYLGCFCQELGIPFELLFRLGSLNGQFNLTRFAYRCSSITNAVSCLHAKVTQDLFHNWNPEIPSQDIPIQYVTNGVHTTTWLSEELMKIYDSCLPDWQNQLTNTEFWEQVESIPDVLIWQGHQNAKERLIKTLGLPIPKDALIIGFARRFATYKRAHLVLHDLKRFAKIANDVHRPLYLVYAGKAHPADKVGQDLIRRIIEISREANFQNRIFFVENYDIAVAKLLVQGTDLWLNTPLKPMEASGTSGQKAGINGVLNCSIRDGWWDEGFNGLNGWEIPSSYVPSNREYQDSASLYSLLEEEIVPLFYARDKDGLPSQWIKKMKQSILSLTPKYSTSRMLAEYLNKFYLPLGQRGTSFRANNYETAKRVNEYKKFIIERWHQIEVLALDLVATNSGTVAVKTKVKLGEIWHKDVKVEAVGSNGHGGIWKHQLVMSNLLGPGIYEYGVEYPGSLEQWSGANPNLRVIPISPDFANDFELELTRWGQSQWR